MKGSLGNYSTSNQARIFTALVLTGILSVGSGLTVIKNSSAAAVGTSPDTTNEVLKQNFKQNQLPRSIVNVVLQDLSGRTGISTQELQIINYSQQNWRNGCLELSQPDEFCTQAIVPGWRVVVSDGRQNWVYHTNQTGSAVRLNEKASQTASQKLPQTVNDGVLRQASQVSQLPISELKIVAYKQKRFSRGCENPAIRNLCDPIIVSGWEVFVKSANRISPWVFLSDESGSQIQLASNDKPNGNTGNVTPVPIPKDELPPPLDQNVLFRQITSGGLAGTTYETVLLNDGRLIRVKVGDANDSERKVRRVSLQEVQQFQQLLIRQKFAEFKNLSYPAPSGAADYVTYTLTSPEGTVKYNNITLYQLPQNLRIVLKGWNRLRSNSIADSSTGGGVGGGVPIPSNELPPPLDQDVVFRQISSGGFVARTYETVLLKDGTLIRVRIGDANDSERSVRRISPQQVQQFLKIVERSRFADFKNLSYPAPQGSADYITYTLTSKEGTVRYNDISQQNLPKNLLAVVNAWNQIGSIAK